MEIVKAGQAGNESLKPQSLTPVQVFDDATTFDNAVLVQAMTMEEPHPLFFYRKQAIEALFDELEAFQQNAKPPWIETISLAQIHGTVSEQSIAVKRDHDERVFTITYLKDDQRGFRKCSITDASHGVTVNIATIHNFEPYCLAIYKGGIPRVPSIHLINEDGNKTEQSDSTHEGVTPEHKKQRLLLLIGADDLCGQSVETMLWAFDGHKSEMEHVLHVAS